MKLRFSPIAFMVAYCVVYGLTLFKDFPMFRYFPLHGDFHWGAGKVPGIGPAMAWYGLMAYAALAGLVAGFVVPNSWLDRPLRNLTWVFPVATMLLSVFLMKKFFA